MFQAYYHVQLRTVGQHLVLIHVLYYFNLLFLNLIKCIFNTILDVIKGWDPMDSTTLRRPLNKSKFPISSLTSDKPMHKLCVGIPKEFHCPGLSPEVIETWNDVTDLLEKCGAHVVQVSFIEQFFFKGKK